MLDGDRLGGHRPSEGRRSRRRRCALARLVLPALAIAALGCAAADDASAPEVVLARVGLPERPAQVHPPQHAVVIRFAGRARQAVPASVEGFEIELPPRATRLRLSTAGAPGAPAALTIELRPQAGADWHPFASPPAPPDRTWRDHEWPLPATADGARLRLRAPTRGGKQPALWGSIQLLGPAAEVPPANLVLISLDTLGAAHVGALSGQPDLTPRLDRFLAESASLRRAFAHYGNTLVSHASLFSALAPRRHGVYTDHLPGPLDTSLVRRLAEAGYHTAAITEGAFVSAAFGFGVGFDAYDETRLGLEEQMAGGAAETLSLAGDFVARHGLRERFALFVHTYEVHAPYLPRDARAQAVADRRTPGDTRVFPARWQGGAILRHNAGEQRLAPRDLARLEALHEAEVHTLDALLGRFLDRLEAASPARETLVVVTADHGDQFGEWGKVSHGETLHNRVIHVPLGIRWPGVVVPRSFDAPVGLVDVMPTVLDLLGLPMPPDRDGTSLADALRDDAQPLPERIVVSEQRTARGECLQLGEEPGCRLDRLAVQGPRFKLVLSARPPGEALYDLASDPLEERDVSDRHPEAVARLRARAEAYAERPPLASEAGGGRLDEETVRRLRALGYVDAAGAH